ncbi:MAG: hypothetical protein AABZ06_14585, partial [Bdellovibrionota bacterium]
MKILFCVPFPLDLKLGASQAAIELANGMEKSGWKCTMASENEIYPDINQYKGIKRMSIFAQKLRKFLQQHAMRFDAVDYDVSCLPYPRSDFYKHTLFVARSQLLHYHFKTIKIPRFKTWRSLAGLLIKEPLRKLELNFTCRQTTTTLKNADL